MIASEPGIHPSSVQYGTRHTVLGWAAAPALARGGGAARADEASELCDISVCFCVFTVVLQGAGGGVRASPGCTILCAVRGGGSIGRAGGPGWEVLCRLQHMPGG